MTQKVNWESCPGKTSPASDEACFYTAEQTQRNRYPKIALLNQMDILDLLYGTIFYQFISLLLSGSFLWLWSLEQVKIHREI